MDRRAYLGAACSTLTVLAGCTGGGNGESVDSDGDGVPDSEDYAPQDPSVQEKSDLTSPDGDGDSGQNPSPTPTETELPGTQTDTLSPTPTREPTPTPTESPTPEPTPAPDEDSYSFSGSSDSATSKFGISGGLVTFDMQHSGSRNFAIWVLNDQGEKENLIVNAIGSWDGRFAQYLDAGDYVLDISADGSWSVDVHQPRYSEVEVQYLPQSMERTYSDYIGPFWVDGLTRASLTAENDDHYGVWLRNHHGQTVELLFNEIGPFEGDTAFGGDGIALITVDTNGKWKLAVQDG